MKLKSILIIILFLLSTYTFADFNAKVVKIVDGDTIHAKDYMSNKTYKVRLLGIDAPEKNQSFGNESTLFLKKRITGKFVTIISKSNKNKPYTLDFYKRILGKVVLYDIDINLEMVQKGMAWHYKKYKKSQPKEDRHSYNKAEKEARKKNIGLWSNENPLAPWKWRKSNRRK